MVKLKILVGSIVMVILFLVLPRLLTSQEFIVSLTQSEIQEKLDEKFPIRKNYFAVLHLFFSKPQVVLREGSDRISFRLNALLDIVVTKQQWKGTASITTGIRYDPESYSFYLDDPVLDSLEIQGVPIDYMDQVNKAAQSMTKERLRNCRVYTLKEDKLGQQAARWFLKDLVVRDGKLLITLGL